jgi:hypothetical protein
MGEEKRRGKKEPHRKGRKVKKTEKRWNRQTDRQPGSLKHLDSAAWYFVGHAVEDV